MRMMLSISVLAMLFTTCLQAQESGKSSDATTLQGCLQYNHRHYVLTDSSGTAHQLAGSLSKLKPHVGHEVEVTGSEAVHTRSTTQEGAASSAHMTPVFTVTAVKHIADSCTAASH